jgi:hypothetical protein
MRTVFLLPLAVGVAVVAGCGLTLQAPAVGVEIASPVELQRLPTQTHTLRPSRRAPRPAAAPRPGPLEPKPVLAAVAPAPALALPTSVASPASAASDAGNDRELSPGETVTLIPAGGGPSTASDEPDEYPRALGRPMVVRGGGNRPPRGWGPGIGITVFPLPRLR